MYVCVYTYTHVKNLLILLGHWWILYFFPSINFMYVLNMKLHYLTLKDIFSFMWKKSFEYSGITSKEHILFFPLLEIKMCPMKIFYLRKTNNNKIASVVFSLWHGLKTRTMNLSLMRLVSLGVSDISKNYTILGTIYISMSMCYLKPALGLKKRKRQDLEEIVALLYSMQHYSQ